MHIPLKRSVDSIEDCRDILKVVAKRDDPFEEVVRDFPDIYEITYSAYETHAWF